MNFEDLLIHEGVSEKELLPRTQRQIEKYRNIEPTPETAQDLLDLNDIIVDEVIVIIANKRAKEQAATEAKEKELSVSEEKALKEKIKIKNKGLFERLTDRFKPTQN